MLAHILPKTTYYWVFAWLGLLLVLTVTAGQFDLGVWNVPIAMGIALAKAALIVLYFMHVRYSPPLVKLFSAASFLWLLILLALTLADYLTRG